MYAQFGSTPSFLPLVVAWEVEVAFFLPFLSVGLFLGVGRGSGEDEDDEDDDIFERFLKEFRVYVRTNPNKYKV